MSSAPASIQCSAQVASRSTRVHRSHLLQARAAAVLTRLRHWEFWPSWAVYLPLVPYIALLAIRHRRYGGLFACTHCNPSIPFGGIVGESKWDILQLLPDDAIVPSARIEQGSIEQRLAHLASIVHEKQWNWPIILKPDVGERGRGVHRIHSLAEAHTYLSHESGRVIAQACHPGPFEAGVFYVRLPGEPVGRIFSLTDKQFPFVIGDGQSSLRTLVWKHSRYRAQASAHLASLGARADDVPALGERVPLGHIGNHCRGTLFLDGEHLITPQLSAKIDSIAKRTRGFFFGRFDIRYSDPHELRDGRGFQIVELNGLLSESTNIYDPRISYWSAQRILREQWRLAFEAGSRNRREELAARSGEAHPKPRLPLSDAADKVS